ncbi:MAG: hypothetical protein RSB43_11560, partial [Niameybacter sp.]
MFKRKNKRVRQYIEIVHGKKYQLSIYSSGEIPIKEAIIIEKSIQFFNDPEPCYIHRGAVYMRINEEVMQIMKKYDAHKCILIDEYRMDL